MESLIGIFRDCHNNGQKARTTWLGGKKEGEWTYSSENGLLLKAETYQNDELVHTEE